jgi:hypothetical protein
MREDAVRRGLKAIPESEGIGWLCGHLDYCTAPLLGGDWVLDADTKIKPLYGRQEGAELGYNPKKPAARATSIAATCWRMCGSSIGRDCWSKLLRGDKSFSSDALAIQKRPQSGIRVIRCMLVARHHLDVEVITNLI